MQLVPQEPTIAVAYIQMSSAFTVEVVFCTDVRPCLTGEFIDTTREIVLFGNRLRFLGPLRRRLFPQLQQYTVTRWQ